MNGLTPRAAYVRSVDKSCLLPQTHLARSDQLLSHTRAQRRGSSRIFNSKGDAVTQVSTSGKTSEDARGQEDPNPPVASSSAPSTPDSKRSASPLAFPALARRLLSQTDAAAVAESLLADQSWLKAASTAGWTVSARSVSSGSDVTYVTLPEDICQQLLQASLDKGNFPLALSIFAEMDAVRGIAVLERDGDAPVQRQVGVEGGLAWPAISTKTIALLVLGLCQQLRTAEAMRVIEAIPKQGLPRNEDVGFGKVVTVPLDTTRPLAVVQPQEGCRVAADAFTRYEFELFSGDVVTAKSQALERGSGLLNSLLRTIGLVKTPPAAATHEFVVRAPDGTSRTFRAATATADVPGQPGERVTVVSCPTKNLPRLGRRGSMLPPNPPDTSPGQPLAVTNHRTGALTALQKLPSGQAGLPAWVLPVAVVLASSDAAMGFINPNLPALAAGGALLAAGSVAAGKSLVLPRLRQLPSEAVKVEYIRQRLLAQHSSLYSKLTSVLLEAADDTRSLARLWQLQNKMGVSGGGSGGGGTYQARINRVASARKTVEQRLAGRLELLDGYSRVINMIEIEVELDSEVPAAEVAGIEMQIDRLVELEVLQEDWRLQAEAGDEVEKLLRSGTF